MTQLGSCPRCQLEISRERQQLVPVICDHCGFVTSANEEKVDNAFEKRAITYMAIVSAVFLSVFIQVANWDQYALEILPLTTKAVLGVSAASDWERHAEICMTLKKYDCVEREYTFAAKADASKYNRLGKFQMKRSLFGSAAQSYYSFFKSGGQDLQASYDYAVALSHLDQVDEAIKYFEQVLAARPDVLQVTVVQNYVKLLMDHQRFAEARKLIENVRSLQPESNSFMEAEFQKIQEMTTASR